LRCNSHCSLPPTILIVEAIGIGIELVPKGYNFVNSEYTTLTDYIVESCLDYVLDILDAEVPGWYNLSPTFFFSTLERDYPKIVEEIHSLLVPF
jgi:hypothetical protein